jgi:hypothetical protein
MESSATVWAGAGGRIANNGPLGGSVQRVNDDIVELFADGVLEKVKKKGEQLLSMLKSVSCRTHKKVRSKTFKLGDRSPKS